ncbi:hypothetical protein REPUB_Repub03eG0235400 [Reevesia pubescens]
MAATIDLKPEYRVDGSCWKFVPVFSDGLFNQKPEDNIFRHPFILLLMQLAIIFCLTNVIHIFLGRYHLPRLLSEVLAGLILGPTVLGRFFPEISDVLFPKLSEEILATLTRFGYLFFMFLIGVKMDVSLIRKSGKREWTIGSVVIMIPLTVTVSTANYISITVDKMDKHTEEWVALFSGVLMLTSFPVVAILLMHLKIINSELGNLVLSSALISDLISVVMVNFDLYGKLIDLAGINVATKSLVLCLALVVFIVKVLGPVMYWIIRRTPEGKPVKDAYLFILMIALLIVAIVGDNVGLQYMYGPFILGLTVPTGPPLASTLIEKLDTIVTGWMLPLMSTYCGYKSNLWLLNQMPPAFVIFVNTFGFLLKTTCGFVPAICFKMPLKDATALALMLTAKGIIELGTFATNADRQSIDPHEFTLGVVVVFLFAAIVPIVTRNLYDPSKTYAGYQKRSIVNSSTTNEGLRVLACAHKQDDALSAIKLLELSNPTTESPLSVYGLYLEELVGGSSPLLLNHQLGQKSSSDGTRWQPIIDVFNYFKSQNQKQTDQVQVFTAISPPKLMHEDICWVAFKNSAALIILPFHRKWNKKGKMILDRKDLRDLNCNVLKKSPCSVGILIDRSRTSGPSVLAKSPTYNVCVIYVGGKDDREALALARRMRWPSLYLTVVRVIMVSSDCCQQGWEDMLDNECLRELKHSSEKNENVIYEEVTVRDGADTSMVVESLLGKSFDLILVGRHSETDSPVLEGLSEWVEFPELGPIGDLLASSAISNPISIFVVQQQITENK